jgi:hypothetical protein
MDDPRMGPGGSIPETLFKAWGITMESGKAVADYTYATRLRNRNNQVETNPLWLSAQAGAFNADNLITANLESMLLPVAGTIEALPDSTYTVETLVQPAPTIKKWTPSPTVWMWQPCGGNLNRQGRYAIWLYASRVHLKRLFRTGSRRHSPKTANRRRKRTSTRRKHH